LRDCTIEISQYQKWLCIFNSQLTNAPKGSKNYRHLKIFFQKVYRHSMEFMSELKNLIKARETKAGTAPQEISSAKIFFFNRLQIQQTLTPDF
jgi:hypothetical protein